MGNASLPVTGMGVARPISCASLPFATLMLGEGKGRAYTQVCGMFQPMSRIGSGRENVSPASRDPAFRCRRIYQHYCSTSCSSARIPLSLHALHGDCHAPSLHFRFRVGCLSSGSRRLCFHRHRRIGRHEGVVHANHKARDHFQLRFYGVRCRQPAPPRLA